MSTITSTSIASSALPSFKEETTFNPTSFTQMRDLFKSRINALVVDINTLNTDKIDTADSQTPTGLWTFVQYPVIQTYVAPTNAIQFTPKQYVDDQIAAVSGGGLVTAAFLIIDSDNAGTEVDTYLGFNRGSTDSDARLMWDVSETEFALYSDNQVTLANLKLADGTEDDHVVTRGQVVLDTTNQTVAGDKTFSGLTTVNGAFVASSTVSVGTTTFSTGNITNASLILDSDNAGAGANIGFLLNRGSTDTDAQIFWDEADDEFTFRSDQDPTLANLKIADAVEDDHAVTKQQVVLDTGNQTIAGVKTFSDDPIIPDEAYGVGWDSSLEPPTKNAVYDKIETVVTSVAAVDVGMQMVISGGEQRISTTTLTDSDLTFACTSGNVYVGKVYIFHNSLSSGGVKFEISFDGTSSDRQLIARSIDDGSTVYDDIKGENGFAATTITSTNITGGVIVYEFRFTCTGDGDFTLQFAQSSSQAFASYLLKGSYIEYREVA